jgi:hypothetical protein
MPINHDIIHSNKTIYEALGWKISDICIGSESREYGACDFKLNDFNIKYRVAKTTPTKLGQFVTIWKRNNNSVIIPYDANDSFDLLVINLSHGNNLGQFVFPKSVLLEQGIISYLGKGGKRAMRVYPTWDITISSKAKVTQTWQIKYFLNMTDGNSIDLKEVRDLYRIV